MRSLLMLIALGTMLPAAAQEFRPLVIELPPDPAEILHASFDEGWSEDGSAAMPADLARGSAEFSPLVYDRGNSKDVAAYRATSVEGVVGRALHLGGGQSHRYRADGNVNLRRGTVAFWLRLALPPGEIHHSLFSIVTAGRTGMLLGVRGRYGDVLVGGPFGTSYDWEAGPWEADTWYHLAITWDETRGFRLYRNGERTRTQEPLTWQSEHLEPDRIMIGSWNHWGGTERPFDFDELHIFARELSDDEVRALYRAEADVAAQPAQFTPEIAAYRAQFLGWESCPEMLAIEPAADEETLLVRQAGLQDARAIYAQAWKVADGDRETRWPLTYHGYSFQDEGGLIMRLEDGARWDYLRIGGPVRGQLYRGEQIFEPQGEAWMPIASEGPLFARSFDGPVTETEMTFFAEPEPPVEEGAEPAPRTLIQEIGFYETGPAATAELPERAEAWPISAEPWGDWSSEIGRIMLSKYETYDRVALNCSAQPAPEARSFTLPALQFRHFMIPAADQDRSLGALRAALYFRDLPADTVLWAYVADPLIPTRQIADFEVRAAGEWSGIRRLDLTLDLRDTVIPAGRPLWVRLVASKDAELVFDGGEHQSRFELRLVPMEALADEYRHDQLAFVKDRFIDVSEPRPWGRTSMDDLGERVAVFNELNRALRDLHTRFPEDPYARAVYIWTHPSEPVDRSALQPPTVDGAPEWAVYQRAALRRYLDFVYWWMDHRQAPNGEFGHNYGDDTDLINDWVSLANISDPDGRIADSVRRLAEFCWETGKLADGINARQTDPLHAYEEGVNVICREADLYYGNPVYLERLMLGTRTVQERLTGLTGGFRHFRSTLYGAARVITEPPYDRDILSSTLMLHPALILGWQSRNPYATGLVREYGDAWIDLVERALAELDGPFTGQNVLPSAVRFADRSVVGRTSYITGYGAYTMFLALAEWTGDERYWLPARLWLARQSIDPTMLPELAARTDLSADREWILQRAAEQSYEALNPQMGNEPRSQIDYGAWLLDGDRTRVLRALRDSWERIELLFPMHTWIEQSADRVAISKDLVDRMYLGGQPGFRNFIYPTHAISWRGFSPDFAAWVLENDAQNLKLMAYNFAEQPQRGQVQLWRLEPGTYVVTTGPDADEDGIPDTVATEQQVELAKGSTIDVELPARQTLALQIEQIARSGENYYARPDLAVCAQDTTIAEDASEITVVVHNIGGGTAPQFTVVAAGDDGGPDLTASAGPLEAPLDCVPRAVTLTIPVPAERRGRQFTVRVDPAGEVAELYEGNNTVVLPAG